MKGVRGKEEGGRRKKGRGVREKEEVKGYEGRKERRKEGRKEERKEGRNRKEGRKGVREKKEERKIRGKEGGVVVAEGWEEIVDSSNVSLRLDSGKPGTGGLQTRDWMASGEQVLPPYQPFIALIQIVWLVYWPLKYFPNI